MTDKNLLSEIEKIVALNLPSLQATAFKSYIEEAEKNKKSLTEKCLQIEKWQKDYESVTRANEKWRQTNQELELLIFNQNEFAKNKQCFESDKLKFEIEKKLLLQDIEHYKREASLTTNLFSIAFKNPEFKRSIIKDVPYEQYNRQDTCNGYAGFETKTTGILSVKEETKEIVE